MTCRGPNLAMSTKYAICKPFLAIKKNVMQKTVALQHGQYYHIYNCGINGERLFREATNYEYFLKLYEKYIDPIAETFAWCLMGNHFHLLVRIREEAENIKHLNLTGFKNLSDLEKNTPPHQHFSNLFNAYSKAINKRYHRHGSLFERPFKRKLIDNEKYLKQLVLYIHNNPVHHGFCNHPVEYAWSSYLTCISAKPAKIKCTSVLNWFDDIHRFESDHIAVSGLNEIEAFLDL
jgi:putative transposase